MYLEVASSTGYYLDQFLIDPEFDDSEGEIALLVHEISVGALLSTQSIFSGSDPFNGVRCLQRKLEQKGVKVTLPDQSPRSLLSPQVSIESVRQSEPKEPGLFLSCILCASGGMDGQVLAVANGIRVEVARYLPDKIKNETRQLFSCIADVEKVLKANGFTLDENSRALQRYRHSMNG